MTPDMFAAETSVSRETLDRLRTHVAMLEKWQPRLNLVGTATLADVWSRHILESVRLWPLFPANAHRLLDIGSGAGFPGVVLAIVSGIDTHLVEADQRKAVFLREVARMSAAPVTVHACRIEALEPFPVDVVTARAVAPVSTLLTWVFPFLGLETVCLFPKGSRVDSQLAAARRTWCFEAVWSSGAGKQKGGVLRLEKVARS